MTRQEQLLAPRPMRAEEICDLVRRVRAMKHPMAVKCPPADLPARDARVVDMYAAGIELDKIAEDTGVSIGHLNRIVRRSGLPKRIARGPR